MSSIATYLNQILRSVYGKDVRQAIHDAISECYDDVNAPALQTEAMQAAVQAKIDAGEMAALTIADGTVTGAKLVDGTIPTAKIADGAITMAKLSNDIDLDVETDTTLTQPGVPADAKAVGDALAEAMTGESLEDDESMKFVLSSKYDDFKLVDGYGFFDAKELIDYSVDFGGRPMSPQADDNNVVFRWADQNGYFKLGEGGVIEGLFSPDYPMERPNISSRSTSELESALKSFEPGYWVEKVTTREERYFAVPKDAYGDSETLGTYISNYLDGSIGIKMDESKIVEYDPSDALLATTSGGSYGESSVDGTVYYTGFLSFTWSSVFDFSYNASALRRMYSTYGLLFNPSYPKENVRFQGNDRLWYKIKKDKVGGANNLTNIKDYLANVKHLKFYYAQD